MDYERIGKKKVLIGSQEWKEAKQIKDKLIKVVVKKPSQLPQIKNLRFVRVERKGDTVTIYFESKKKPTKEELQTILTYLNNPFEVAEIDGVV